MKNIIMKILTSNLLFSRKKIIDNLYFRNLTRIMFQFRPNLRMRENKFLEFKKKADHPEKIVREMVAFANTEGGTLLIGVDDRGNISGLLFPDEDTFVMEAAILMYSKPALEYTLDSIPVGEGN